MATKREALTIARRYGFVLDESGKLCIARMEGEGPAFEAMHRSAKPVRMGGGHKARKGA